MKKDIKINKRNSNDIVPWNFFYFFLSFRLIEKTIKIREDSFDENYRRTTANKILRLRK